MKILVTGGTGYIGSHTCLALMAAGLEPVILDNLCNSKLSVLKRIEEVAGKAPVFLSGRHPGSRIIGSYFSGTTDCRCDPFCCAEGSW